MASAAAVLLLLFLMFHYKGNETGIALVARHPTCLASVDSRLIQISAVACTLTHGVLMLQFGTWQSASITLLLKLLASCIFL